MKKIVVVVFFVSNVFYANPPQALHIPKCSREALEAFYVKYLSDPGPYAVYVEYKPLGFEKALQGNHHYWWQHFTRYCTLKNGLAFTKTIMSATFLMCFGAAFMIHKTYGAVRKIQSFFLFRSVQYNEETYRSIKKYELLFIFYKKLDHVLLHRKIRHYFAVNDEFDALIEDMLAYITMYERHQAEQEI